MQIIVNGERTIMQTVTLFEFLKRTGMLGKRFAVELNGKIVPKSKFDQTPLAEGDILEIIHAIGGG